MLIRPVPAAMLLVLRKERKSVPPVASSVPLVTVQVNSGIPSGGNAVTPLAVLQVDTHVAPILFPTVNVPLLET